MAFRRFASYLLITVLAVLCLFPAAAPAEEKAETIVRVGWYETPFNHKDAYGRRSGYAYDFQRKIAAYTGWKYEYVEGSWAELLQMLKDGRIDLMSDVSYVEERTEYMLYSNIPMGSELYYLYISTDNKDILPNDYSTLNGKKVGITQGSYQCGLFADWMDTFGVSADVIELSCSELDSLAMLQRGDLDAFVTLDTYGDVESYMPLWKIGSSDFFFVVAKDRTDLLAELNTALNRIQDENKNYTEQLSNKYLRNYGTNFYLTTDEKDWLESHGKIRVGFQDNYLAFCAADANGELTGALKDYLAIASGVLDNAAVEFEAYVYPTAAAAIEALKNGEVDCMFPANLTDYDAEQEGVVMTSPLMRTEMDAVVRAEDQKDFLRRSTVRVGVNRGNPNYEMFLMDNYPSWTPVFFADTLTCLNEVAAKNADCIIISNYRYSDIAAQCRRLNLTTVYTGVDMDYCLAVKEGNPELYSILSKIIGLVPESSVNASLNYYASETVTTSFMDMLLNQLPAIILGVACLVLLFLLLRGRARQRKEAE